MKNKAIRIAILVLIISIEFAVFNKEVKSGIVHFLCPCAQDLYANHFILLKISFLIIFCIIATGLWIRVKNKEKKSLLIVFLVKGFQSKGSDFVGLLNVIFIICSISWIASSLYEHSATGIVNASLYVIMLLLYPLIISNIFSLPKHPDLQKGPKVLITAVSMITKEEDIRASMKLMEEKYSNQWNSQVIIEKDGTIKKNGDYIWGPWLNYDPIRKSIIKHSSTLDRIVLVSSSEVRENTLKLSPEFQPEKLILDLLRKIHIDRPISVDFNEIAFKGSDIHAAGKSLEHALDKLYDFKYIDEDIVFNITSGTVPISGAMIIKAIPGERQAEYANQDTGQIIQVPLDIFTLKELWNELIEKVQ